MIKRTCNVVLVVLVILTNITNAVASVLIKCLTKIRPSSTSRVAVVNNLIHVSVHLAQHRSTLTCMDADATADPTMLAAAETAAEVYYVYELNPSLIGTFKLGSSSRSTPGP